MSALRVAARDDVEFHSNFLDTLDTDIPSGSWAPRPAFGLIAIRF